MPPLLVEPDETGVAHTLDPIGRVVVDQAVGQPLNCLLFADSNDTHHSLLGVTSISGRDSTQPLPAPPNPTEIFDRDDTGETPILGG